MIVGIRKKTPEKMRFTFTLLCLVVVHTFRVRVCINTNHKQHQRVALHRSTAYVVEGLKNIPGDSFENIQIALFRHHRGNYTVRAMYMFPNKDNIVFTAETFGCKDAMNRIIDCGNNICKMNSMTESN